MQRIPMIAATALTSALLALMLLGGCSAPAGEATAEGAAVVEKISAEAAHEMMEAGEGTVLDVRTPEEYADGHVPNARLLTLDTINAETAAAAVPDKEEPVLVYCRSGVRSAEAARKLADLGYRQVYDFGGIIDWPYETATD